jgi:hypothetical protein
MEHIFTSVKLACLIMHLLKMETVLFVLCLGCELRSSDAKQAPVVLTANTITKSMVDRHSK